MKTGRLMKHILSFGMLVGLFALTQPAMAIDAPHDYSDNPPVTPMECDDCHGFHGTSYPSALENLCESCHFSGGPAPEVETHSSRTTDTGYGNWDIDCWGCHDPHTQEQETWPAGPHAGKFVRRYMGGSNYGHIKEIDPADATPEYYEEVDIPPLGDVARDVTSSIIEYKSNTEFVDSDGSSADDICRVCHENTSNYTTASNTHSDYGADSQPGGNCLTCHAHTGGFKPEGGDCLACHNKTQPNVDGVPSPPTDDYRRQVTEFSGGDGDFTRTSHHVTDLSTTEIVTQEDCEVCHDQSNHQSNTDPQVLFNDPDDTLTNYTYNGTGSSIETFCLNCHDSDGATAYDAVTPGSPDGDPFTDGYTPPDIASSWVGSSHDGGLTTEACLSCHGGADSTRSGLSYDQNAHGSANAKLLSSLVAGESPTNFEEEFSYACHDGAPASTDIEGQFNGATNYQDATSGTGLLINQRHDISDADQTYSSAVVECTNCHNPHMATSTNKNIDPDTPTSAYTFTYDTSNSWTGTGNKSYTRDGYNFTYYNTTSDYNPMNPIGCTGTPGTIDPAIADGGNTGDDTGTSGGTYTGLTDIVYTVTVSTGGAPVGGPTVTDVCTGSGASGPSCGDDTLTSSGTYSGPTPETYTIDVSTAGDCQGGGKADFTVTCSSDTGGDCGTTKSCNTEPYTLTLGSRGLTAQLDDTSGGVEFATSEQWQVQVTTPGGGPQITVTSTGSVDDSGPTDVTAFGTPINVGTLGVTISFTDGGDGVLTAGDTWTISTTGGSAGCITDPEPDMITFCLVCHDGTVPTGVTMSANMVNIATEYRDTDYHGRDASGSSGNGFMKAPWADISACDTGPVDGFCDSELSQHYAALQCTTCHDQHGSDNLFHLRSSITVRGQIMSVGGGPGSGQEANPFTSASDYGPGDTTYQLPCFDGSTQVSCTNPAGVQLDHKWGAWCSFCHDLQTHGQTEDNSCRTGHKHGGGAF